MVRVFYYLKPIYFVSGFDKGLGPVTDEGVIVDKKVIRTYKDASDSL